VSKDAWDFDLFTIGAGSGGVRASRMSAALGARVAVAEEDRLGGTCVNVGCIPKKLLVLASHFADDFADAAAYGWSVPPASFDWPTLVANKDREIDRLNHVYARLLDEAGVTRIDGHARLIDPHTVEVGGRRVTARHILVATGSRPHLPDVPGIEHVSTSGDMFHLPRLPERLVIVGGGYIAVEFAGIMHGLGVDVTLLYRGPLFLRGFDDDLRATLAAAMRARGIGVRFDASVARVERVGAYRTVILEGGERIEADHVLYATGRRPLTEGLGLGEAGVGMTPGGAIAVDEYSRTSVPSIWAIGDVTDRIQLTPVAINEGIALAKTLFGGTPTRPDHENVPSAVFSQPPIATVGLTEAEARGRRGDVVVYSSRFRALRHTLTGRDEPTMMKLVVEAGSQRVIGAHMVGPDAPEIVQGVAVAVKMGATKADFDATVGIHPTSAEEFVTMREPAG
jgi:glutathione reductase (NADPH)